jgi:hypothetical protein
MNENNIIIPETNKLEFTIYRFLEVNLKTKLHLKENNNFCFSSPGKNKQNAKCIGF